MAHYVEDVNIHFQQTLKKTNFMAPFYGWGSTASRLVPPRVSEHGIPGLEVLRLNR